jgi:hypothetical protein
LLESQLWKRVNKAISVRDDEDRCTRLLEYAFM